MMLGWLRRLPSFGAKVTWLLTLIGGLAILLVSIGLVLVAYVDLRREVLSAVQSQAQLVAMNSSAPLAFGDRSSGQEALASLRGMPYVASATVFDDSGNRFAQFLRTRDPAPAMPLDAPGLHRAGPWLVLIEPVEELGHRLGAVQVVFDLDRLYRRLATMMGVALVIAAASMLLIFIVARRLRDVLVQPIDDLARTAREISDTRNYALRASRVSSDEVGQFTDAFNDMLAQIQQQHAELQLARGQAEHASQMKDEFLATLSHELRTPLVPILGWSQILLRAADDAKRVVQGAEVIERNARIQTQIVDDMLDMSRIISGKLLLRTQSMDLRSVAEAALATVQPAAEARGVRIDTRLDPSLPLVRGDPGRLQQVIWNLLTNAIKFTPRDGSVQLRLVQIDGQAELTVSDSGQGIAAEFLPHVFERFRQAHSSTTRIHGGLGLGLAIVKQLVEQHGGSVHAHSAGVGQGASFVVRLPIAAGQRSAAEGGAGPAPAMDLPEAAPLQGLTVLLVDDDADGRFVLAQMLVEAGALVYSAASAAEAMVVLPQRLPDVLISDIGMPDCDGYGLIERVRLLPQWQGGQTPAIALTAFAREEDRSRALLAGFQMHVGKPVDANELIAATTTVRRHTGMGAGAPR